MNTLYVNNKLKHRSALLYNQAKLEYETRKRREKAVCDKCLRRNFAITVLCLKVNDRTVL